jgi:hypothetical protein
MAQPGRQLAPPDTDWTVQAADTIEGLVTSIRNKTTVPLTTVARGIVFGILAAFAGGAAMVLFAILAVRVLNLLPGDVWVAHLITGMVFTLIGVFAWSKRRPVER